MQCRRDLEIFANEIRIELVHTLKQCGFGHIGGSLSMVDLLAVLYSGTMKIDPQNPKWEERDLLVCSKGHAGPGLYATLALKGFFPKEWLMTLNRGGTDLPSHCDKNHTPGIDATTGSLGQGISQAVGMALGAKKKGTDQTVYCIVGDGECQEGQIWEAAMFAAHYKLDNLILFVDLNKKQVDGCVEDVMSIGDIGQKFRAFGWHSTLVDGADHEMIQGAIAYAKKQKGTPSVIVLDTVKGAGIPMMEEHENCHHLNLSPEMCDEMLEHLYRQADALKEGI